MKIVSLNNGPDLDAIEVDWNRLCEQEMKYVPSFGRLRAQLRATGTRYRLLAVLDNSQVKAIACFIYGDTVKRFALASKTLLELSVKEVSLFGSCIPGQPDADTIREMFQTIIDAGGFDVISVGEVLIDSPLQKAVISFPGLIAWRTTRQKLQRWLIRMPGSFEEYLSSLGPETRRHATRYRRKVENVDHEYKVITAPADVPAFLRDAEQISRSSYQWKLGYRIYDDDQTRDRFVQLAKEGVLYCYLLYLGGKPCAFAWGELSHRTFYYQAIGYVPELGKLSPGTALYMWLIQHLIESTNCKTFDFGSGGRDGYKSRLATANLGCEQIQMAQIYRPYPVMIYALDRILIAVKTAILSPVETLLAHGTLKQRLKSVLRPFGVGSY